MQFNIVEAGLGTGKKMLMHIRKFKWFAILSNLLAGVSIWLASWGNSQWSLLNAWGTLVQITKEHRSHFTFPLSLGHCPMLNGRGLAHSTGQGKPLAFLCLQPFKPDLIKSKYHSADPFETTWRQTAEEEAKGLGWTEGKAIHYFLCNEEHRDTENACGARWWTDSTSEIGLEWHEREP